ncbi:hypothetical protein SAY87_012936 [Trapa incisa]|uniref:Uncharacterized protein n=1 Tax=Trapa incisa TaxID=236973 RepID=A0AAN7K7U1_9MYRT|nr:hypothetical protein SAY87_012936 [Trapa incisa]
MSLHRSFSVLALLLILTIDSSFSQVLTSPSPALEHNADAPFSPSPSPLFVGVPSTFHSPPAPAQDLAPSSSPGLSPHNAPELTVPSQSPSESISHGGMDVIATDAPEKSSGGMSGSKKFGIAFAVFVLAGLAICAGMVYKKRQENIRRSRYNYVADANFL